jgi:hypothetical protein
MKLNGLSDKAIKRIASKCAQQEPLDITDEDIAGFEPEITQDTDAMQQVKQEVDNVLSELTNMQDLVFQMDDQDQALFNQSVEKLRQISGSLQNKLANKSK